MNFDLKKLDNLNQPSEKASQKGVKFNPKFLGRARPKPPGQAAKTQDASQGQNAASQTADVPAQPSQPGVARSAAVPAEEQAPAKPVAAPLPAALHRLAGLPKSKPEQQEQKGRGEQQQQQQVQEDGTALSAALSRPRVAKPAPLAQAAADLQGGQAADSIPNQPVLAAGAAAGASVLPDRSAVPSSDAAAPPSGAAAKALQPAVSTGRGLGPLAVPTFVSPPAERNAGGVSGADEPGKAAAHADLGNYGLSTTPALEAHGGQRPVDAPSISKAEAEQPLCRQQQEQEQQQQHQEGQQGVQPECKGEEATPVAPALPAALGLDQQHGDTLPVEDDRPKTRVPALRGKRKTAVVAAEEAAGVAGPESKPGSAGTQQGLTDTEAAQLPMGTSKEPAAKARERRGGSAAALSAARAAAAAAAARAVDATQAAVGDAQIKGATDPAAEDGASAPAAAKRRGRIIPRATKPKPSERAAARKAAAAARKAAKEAAAAAAAAMAAATEAEAAAEAGQGATAGHGTAAEENAAEAEEQEEQPATPKKKQPRRQPKMTRQQAQAQQAVPTGAAAVEGTAASPVLVAPRAAALAAVPAVAGLLPAAGGPRVTLHVVGDKVVLLPEGATGKHFTLGADGQLHPAPVPSPPHAVLGRKGAGRGRKRKGEQPPQEDAGALVVVGEGSEEAAAQSLMEAARKRADKLARKDEPRGPKRAWNRVMPRPANLASKDLDPSKMSLKCEIII